MQLAINIIIFFVGFSIATFVAIRPKRIRHDLERFSSNLRHVSYVMKTPNKPSLLLERPEAVSDDDLIFTKYV